MIWWVLDKKRVPRGYIGIIKGLYEGAVMSVRSENYLKCIILFIDNNCMDNNRENYFTVTNHKKKKLLDLIT